VILNAAGGECLDDFAHLRSDVGFGRSLLDMNCLHSARRGVTPFMSNKLRQPHIAAQVCEIVQALSSAAFKITKTLDERGFRRSPALVP